MTAGMNSVPIPSGLFRGKGHTARLCVRLAAEGGWEVFVEVDGQVVAVRRYDQWHSVERFRAAVEAQLPDAAWIPPPECRR